MAKKLYLVFKMNEAAGKNHFLTVILSKPKNGLTAEAIQSAMQTCVTKKIFKAGGKAAGADIVEAWDAYIREDSYLIDDGEVVGA